MALSRRKRFDVVSIHAKTTAARSTTPSSTASPADIPDAQSTSRSTGPSVSHDSCRYMLHRLSRSGMDKLRNFLSRCSALKGCPGMVDTVSNVSLGSSQILPSSMSSFQTAKVSSVNASSFRQTTLSLESSSDAGEAHQPGRQSHQFHPGLFPAPECKGLLSTRPGTYCSPALRNASPPPSAKAFFGVTRVKVRLPTARLR